MDSSTFFRTHPLEAVVFGTGNIIGAAIFGLDLMAMGLYFLIIIPLVFAEHSNFLFPRWIDTTFGWFIVTPNLHKVHHDQDPYYTDSNFADIFIIWDRLFGTYKYLPVKKIKYGLQEFEDEKKQTFLYLLKSPFIKIKRVRSDESTGSKEKSDVLTHN